ncbi:hypothetical protein RHGRI_002249 [Rhododendron griersonianum]|uniref:Uncharacterized protein n=1 Tax=Rhododendron griersonianum TaxID=479676 RepID=A0AAV6LN92_9ERIC|nr:hypothetical protein RHGRI_002249 [Rhododendron griersonianum]
MEWAGVQLIEWEGVQAMELAGVQAMELAGVQTLEGVGLVEVQTMEWAGLAGVQTLKGEEQHWRRQGWLEALEKVKLVETSVSYNGQKLAFNTLAAFFQRHKNVTWLGVELVAQDVALSGDTAKGMKTERSGGAVELDVRMKARIRLKWWSSGGGGGGSGGAGGGDVVVEEWWWCSDGSGGGNGVVEVVGFQCTAKPEANLISPALPRRLSPSPPSLSPSPEVDSQVDCKGSRSDEEFGFRRNPVENQFSRQPWSKHSGAGLESIHLRCLLVLNPPKKSSERLGLEAHVPDPNLPFAECGQELCGGGFRTRSVDHEIWRTPRGKSSHRHIFERKR